MCRINIHTRCACEHNVCARNAAYSGAHRIWTATVFRLFFKQFCYGTILPYSCHILRRYIKAKKSKKQSCLFCHDGSVFDEHITNSLRPVARGSRSASRYDFAHSICTRVRVTIVCTCASVGSTSRWGGAHNNRLCRLPPSRPRSPGRKIKIAHTCVDQTRDKKTRRPNRTPHTHQACVLGE